MDGSPAEMPACESDLLLVSTSLGALEGEGSGGLDGLLDAALETQRAGCRQRRAGPSTSA